MNKIITKNNINQIVIGVILAGGKSSRMGINKALLKISKSTSLLNFQINILQELACQNIIISTNTKLSSSNKYPQIADICNVSGEQIQGPLAGIYSSVDFIYKTYSQSPSTIIIFLPIDLPKMNEQTLLKLVKTLDKNNGQAAIFNNHNLPLGLKLTTKTYDYINSFFNINFPADKKSQSVGKFLDMFDLEFVYPNKFDEECLTNTNNPYEWKEATGEYPF